MINGRPVYSIVAVDESFGIGKAGTLPWRFKKEMQHFKTVSTTVQDPKKQNAVIMGSTTWGSIPPTFRPLPDRKNIVLSRDASFSAPGATVATSLEEAFSLIDDAVETVFIIGGARVFQDTISHPALDGVYLTVIHHTYDCDTFFPQIPDRFRHKKHLGSDTEKGVSFDYFLYTVQIHPAGPAAAVSPVAA